MVGSRKEPGLCAEGGSFAKAGEEGGVDFKDGMKILCFDVFS
jgi:hypothetical protein